MSIGDFEQNPHADRITQILQSRVSQPTQFTDGARDHAAISSQLLAQAGINNSVGQILSAIGQPEREASDRQLADSKALYDMFEEQSRRGDEKYQNVLNAVKTVTGDDPEGNALILGELMNSDTVYNGSLSQAMTGAIQAAKRLNYKPIKTRKDEASIRASEALSKQRLEGGGGGSSVFSQTMSLIDSDPELSQLPTETKIRIAQNKLGTDLTFTKEGQVVPLEGASQARGELSYGGESGKQQAQLEYIAPKKEAEITAEKKGKQPLAKATLESAIASKENVINKIDSVIPRVDMFTAGFFGPSFSAIPGTPAADLRADLETVKANIGFDKLQEMRNNSPTGGALGQVSERENTLLQAVWSSVEQSQSPEQLRSNLKLLQKQVKESWQRVISAYESDYGVKYDGEMPMMPTGQEEDPLGLFK